MATTGAASRHHVGTGAAGGARAAGSMQRLVQTGSAAPGLFMRVFDGDYQPIPASMKARVVLPRFLFPCRADLAAGEWCPDAAPRDKSS